MATFVNDLRLKEIATGDEAGTWGTSTNTNLELIAEAFSFGTEASFSSDADATTTIADGATDPARSLYLKVTSGVSLSAIRTLTIAPNTVSKVWIIENATSGSQSINISQGSGSNVTIPNGDVRVVYSDGAGSGAAVVDAFTDLNVSGTLTANGGIKIDNITIDGTDISLSSGNLLIDVAGDISLDAGGQDIKFLDDGTEFGKVRNESSDFVIKSSVQDKDIIFKGDDDGSTITALTLDMSNAGAATFNGAVTIPVGSLSAPSLTFAGDPDTGIFRRTANTIDIVTTGVQRLEIDSAGNVIVENAFFGQGGAVFNEASADVDFRVESNSNTHMLFIDGGNDAAFFGGSDKRGFVNIETTAVNYSSGVFNNPHIALQASVQPDDNDGFVGITFATSDSDNYGWSA